MTHKRGDRISQMLYW